MRKSKLFHLLLAIFCLAGLTASLVITAVSSPVSANQPQSATALGTNFPTTAPETYKIEVNQDGIYKITYTDLQTAGMNMAAVNPNTIEMIPRLDCRILP